MKDIVFSEWWCHVILQEFIDGMEELLPIFKMVAACSSKHCKTSVRWHDVTSQKTVLFKLTFSLDVICLLPLILAPKYSVLLMLAVSFCIFLNMTRCTKSMHCVIPSVMYDTPCTC